MNFESKIEDIEINVEILDPIDWNGLRKLGIQMVEDVLVYLKHIRDRSIWKPIPKDIKDFFDNPIPQEPEGPEKTYRDFV